MKRSPELAALSRDHHQALEAPLRASVVSPDVLQRSVAGGMMRDLLNSGRVACARRPRRQAFGWGPPAEQTDDAMSTIAAFDAARRRT
jgi:hypothetical protein